MIHLALGFLLLSLSDPLAPTPASRVATASRGTSALGQDPAFADVSELLEAARNAQRSADLAGARERIVAAVERACAELEEHADPAAAPLLEELARFAHDAGEFGAAEPAWRAAIGGYAHGAHADSADLRRARGGLAATLYRLGDLAGAREIQQAVLDACSRALSADDPELQRARTNLAGMTKALGDLAGALALEEAVLDVYARTLPDEHPDLQWARLSLSGTRYLLGDLDGARELQETVLEVYTRTLPADHPMLQAARANLALTISALGDLDGARELQEAVLAVRERTLPAHHPDLQRARANLAATIKARGDLAGARELEEEVLEAFARTLPPDHPDLQRVRANLAATLAGLGDLAGACALQDAVLAVYERTLPREHLHLSNARADLATTLYALGDLARARELGEAALEVYLRTLPDDHPDLQAARASLALTIKAQGDLAGARELEEAVLAACATLPGDHPHLQAARSNLAATRYALGDLAGALELQEAVLESFARTLPDDHASLQAARTNLASTLVGQIARDPRPEECAAAAERCAELVLALCRSQVDGARAALLTSSVREAEERCARLSESLDAALSFAQGYGVLEPRDDLARAAFELSETTRGAALVSAALARGAEASPERQRWRDELRAASEALAAFAPEERASEAYHRARARREEAERELLALAREVLGSGLAGLALDVDALARCLGEHDAVVAFRRYSRFTIAPSGAATGSASSVQATTGAPGAPEPVRAVVERGSVSLCAFVVRRGAGASPATLDVVDLGPVDAIDAAVRRWRVAIGTGSDAAPADASRGLGLQAAAPGDGHAAGADLRRLAWDPLLSFLGEAERVILAQDDVLHLVPFDALPLGATDAPVTPGTLLGDRWRIEMHVTLSELVGERPAPGEGGVLVALGGASFDEAPADLQEERVATVEARARRDGGASPLRGAPTQPSFAPLPETRLEAREVAAVHDAAFAPGTALVREGPQASCAALAALAPCARFLHVATHGWSAPESIPSWSDGASSLAREGRALRFAAAQRVRGLSPMLLCGLALAGASLPADADGRAVGLLTAEELSTLDLSRCELAVLSACDTNVGERRAGQGVASLQRSLHMAGAATVITSLWKVPDEATRALMLDFYRRVWVEGQPKHQALWAAKALLRDARDERGRPRHTTRDWAAWVLTGDPR